MKPAALTWLLLPFSKIYGVITDVRNWLFDSGLLNIYKPEVFTIGVGNLTVGGTGKTPMIEFLIKRFSHTPASIPYETATLSRGYGRSTKGFKIAADDDTADTLGDEPLQLYRKFGQKVNRSHGPVSLGHTDPSSTGRVRVCVGERRADAIQKLLAEYPETKRVLLDDAFQHRAVRPHLNLLLMDYNRPFFTDYPFPAGRLRERRSGAQRADAIIVTKCPNSLSQPDQRAISLRIRQYTQPQVPIFFAGLQYDQPMSFALHQPTEWLGKVLLVSGLANANSLERYVQEKFSLERHYRFADHHAYSRHDLDSLLSQLRPGMGLLTTEKDWVKLDALLTPDERATLPLYYLPVQVVFLEGDGDRFDQFIDAAR
ncbi:MAG: lpxK [Spirosoma sp.]|nr:lpxK [Spirosoma sp.]